VPLGHGGRPQRVMVLTQPHILDENSRLFHTLGHAALLDQFAGSPTVLDSGDLCQLHVLQLRADLVPKDSAARATVSVRLTNNVAHSRQC
jgi:hypothetical protein